MNWHEEEICKFISNEDYIDVKKGKKRNPNNNDRYRKHYIMINIAWACMVAAYLAVATYFMVR